VTEHSVTEHSAGTWTVRLLMMSCRAMGRGVIEALLAWLARWAAREGAQVVEIPCAVNDRNVPLRLALAAAGFRAADGRTADGRTADGRTADGQVTGQAGTPGRAVFRLDLGGRLPELPDWVSGPGEP
jgi:hypothetical protein